jgi:hypothetical protein
MRPGCWRVRIRRASLLRLSIPTVLLFTTLFISGTRWSPSPTAANQFVQSADIGIENSWVRVQNVGVNPATVTVTYYDEAGRTVGTDTCPSASCPALAPGGGWTFFQGQQPQLPLGYKGSAVIESDQPVVALQAKDVRRDGKFLIAGDTTSIATGSSKLFLPLVANHDGPAQNWNGRFAVQNLSDGVTACITITYLSNAADAEIAWDPYKPGAKGAAKLSGCPNGGRPLPPQGTLHRDPDTFGVPIQYTGSVRIETHKNGQNVDADEQLIAATADTWSSTTGHLASYRGLGESELSTTVLLPLVDREVGPANGWSTHFQIVNKDPKKPAQVTLRFEGFDIDGGAFVAKQNTFTMNAARICFQDRDDGANCLAPGDRLPRTFVGTARLTSTQPIGVIVNRGSYYDDTFTDYRGFAANDGARRVLLPVLNKSYGPYQGKRGWDSWFRVLVADGGNANVTIRYFGLDLPGGEQSYTQTAFREFTVFQFQERILPNGFAGTAIIESDRPIVVLANIYTDVFVGDTNLLYNGIALP